MVGENFSLLICVTRYLRLEHGSSFAGGQLQLREVEADDLPNSIGIDFLLGSTWMVYSKVPMMRSE